MFNSDCPYCNGVINHCGKGCPVRKRSGKRKPRRLMAWDCETVGDRIVLFLASGVDRRASYIYRSEGLHIDDVLRWFIKNGLESLNVGFVFDYDVNQLLRQLPPTHLEQLRARGRVLYRRWRIAHIPGKRFAVTDRDSGRTVVIWDVSGWVHCSFVRLMTDWSLGDAEEREYVAQMKKQRQDLSGVSEADLVRYTALECALLCEWMDRLLELHHRLDITLRAYSGAGSTAAAVLRGKRWRPPAAPAEVTAAAEAAFFGGRSETSRVGPAAGPVYGYDINSAYPAALAKLPDIHDARWYHTTRFEAGCWGFYRVRWRQRSTECWGLFPLRGARLPGGRRSISLLYPTHGEGWFASAEIAAALELRANCVEVVEGWIMEPRAPAFPWLPEMAAERLRLKAAGAPEEFVLKVALNSLYGKLAQHSGSAPYQCIPYAAAVTAATRAALLRIMLTHGHDILLVATDGILSLAPLDLPVGPALGQWEMTTYPDAWILQAGVYWAGPKIRTRGVDGRALQRSAVEEVWRSRGVSGALSVPTRRVLSYRVACARGKPELTGVWENSERQISFSPAPRRRSWKRSPDGAMLTLPARVDEYRMQQIFDETMLLQEPEQGYDEWEAMPDWSYDGDVG